MQKKVLIPLLMAGTATVPALADINIGFPQSGKWTQSGTTGSENPWSAILDSGETEFDNVIGTGEIRTSVNLPKGTYRLLFSNTENIKVFVDGKEITPIAANVYEFAVETAGDIAIVIKPAEENNPCSFTGQSLALVIDGEGIANALQYSWEEINYYIGFYSVDEKDFYEQAEKLRKDRAELAALAYYYDKEKKLSYEDVIEEIRNMDRGYFSLAENLAIYNKYQLYNTPNAPAAALANLAELQQAYNAKVVEENAVWEVYKANKAKYEELKAGQKSLLSNDSNSLIDVAQLRAEIDAWQVVDEAIKADCNAMLDEIEASIVAYGKAIDAAYYVVEYDAKGNPVMKNVALREAIEMTSREPELRAQLANLQTQLKQGMSDYEVYYNVNFVLMDKLDEVLGDYTSTIYHPETVDREKKYGDEAYLGIITNGFRDSVMSEAAANALVKGIKEDCQIENVAGASEYDTEHKCTKTIEDAIDKLTQHKENYINLVTTQDANMVDAQAEIKSMRDKWAMFNSYEVPNDNEEAYKTKLAEAKELIDELEEYVAREYAKHTLYLGDGTDYAYQSVQINDLLNELPSLAGDPIVYINYLQKMLDDARAKVVQEGVREVKVKNEKEGNDGKVTLEPATVIVNVTSKFDGTFAALQKAIDDIDTIEEGEAAIQKYDKNSVAGQIQWAVDNAKAMADKFEAATVYIDVYKHGGKIVDKEVFGPSYTVPYDIGLFQVKGIVKEKGIDNANIEYGDPKKIREGVTVPEVVDAKAAFNVGPFEEKLAEYDDALSKANAAESQEAWQIINELLDDLRDPIVNGNWNHMFGALGSMQQSWKDFVYDCTGLNREYVYRQYTSLQEKVYDAEEARVTNIETVKFDDIEAAILKADQKQETLNKLSGSVKTEAEAADELYKEALAAIYVQEDRVADLVANQDAFKALTVKVQGLEDRLAGLREYNETNSVTPGKEFFEGKIEEIEEKIDALAVKITKAVNNEAAVELTPEYNKEIADIDALISSTWTADETNNRVHNEQLALEKEVRVYIEDLIAQIEADKNKEGLAVVKEWLETLNGLLSKDMVEANIMVTNAYGDGESEVMNAEITAEYNRIKEVAKGIYDVYADELHKAVVAANAETTAAWPVDMIGLDNLYRDGIRKYNYFYYELENPGWRECVSEAIRRHQSLFKYYDEIKSLNEDCLAAVAKWNSENHVITDKEWAKWTKQRDDMWNAISRDVRAMIDDMNNQAENEKDATKGYYPENLKAAKDAISEAEAALTAAGIDTEYLEPAKAYLYEAEFKYWSVDNNGTDLSFAMDDIATVLDQVKPNIDVQAYAQEAWAEVYAAAQETIDDLREELDSYQFADAKVKAAQTKIFNDNVKDATALNNTATTKPNLVDFYKSYCERLQGYLDNMAQAVKTVKESNDLAVENQNIYNDFITWYNGVDADLDALREYCEAMAGCFNEQGTIVDGLQTRLDALKTFVETHKGTLSENDIPGRMADFDAALLGGYEEAAGYEKAYLLRKLTETKVAYNDAYQKHATLPEGFTYEEVNADIRKIDDAVAALVFDADDKDAFKDEAVKYEKELADIYNMLQSTWTENPKAAVLAGLEARYTTINETIATAKRYLDSCLPEVKTQYPDAYKQYEDALNAERAAWQSEGTHVLDREPFHNKVLDEIALQVNNLAGEIRIAQQRAEAEAEKIRISEARYEVLKAQYDGLVEEFEAAKETVEGYGNGISESLTNEANRIQNMLNTALNNLNSARAAHSLNNYSQLTYGNEIDAAIDNYVKRGATQLANLELDKAKAAERNASTALTQNIVPADRTVLLAEYQTANSKLQSLLDEKNRANVARLNEIAEEARALVEKFNSITERANDSAFIPGNVNMDEDGEVNAVDVQALINLIGEGETYESLYAANPRQACAADVAGNKVLDIADVTALIQLIMGDQPQVLKVRARVPGVTGDDHLTIALMGEENGLRRYALSLTNTTEFIGAQFDIRTSGNARIVGMETAERTAAHEVYMFENIDGARAVIASMENAVFAGNDGVVMYVDVEGKGELTVHHAGFADKDNVTHLLDKAHTSSINAIIDGFKDGASRIYDAAGRAYNRLQKGINIIRHKDGSVTKEMHK